MEQTAVLNKTLLAQCMECPQTIADAWFPSLWAEMSAARINTPRRIGHFLAQIGHESQGLTRGEENLRYSAKRLAEVGAQNGPGSVWARAAAQSARLANNPRALANFVYANRGGNGDEASGDGWLYRGRGPIGLTFHDAYEEMQRLTGRPILDDPDRVSTVEVGAAVACAWWNKRNLNQYADANDSLSIGRVINLGDAKKKRMPMGHEDRVRRTRLVFRILGVS